MVLINHIFFNRKIVKMMKEMMRERERRRKKLRTNQGIPLDEPHHGRDVQEKNDEYLN